MKSSAPIVGTLYTWNFLNRSSRFPYRTFMKSINSIVSNRIIRKLVWNIHLRWTAVCCQRIKAKNISIEYGDTVKLLNEGLQRNNNNNESLWWHRQLQLLCFTCSRFISLTKAGGRNPWKAFSVWFFWLSSSWTFSTSCLEKTWTFNEILPGRQGSHPYHW